MKRCLLLILSVVVLMAGCDKAQQAVDHLKSDVEAYKAAPSEKAEAAVETDLSRVNDELARLEKEGKTDRAAELRREAGALRSDFEVAKLANTIQNAKRTLEGFGNAVKQSAEQIKDAFQSPSPTPVR